MEDEDFKQKVLSCMQRNTEAIEKLTEDTKGLVEAWNASESALKVAKVFGKFMLWITTVGTPIIALIYWLKTGHWK
jgi:K+/H+ antiporter YhaU regulatory subunit KhtT